MKFRKKPVVIEALQWESTGSGLDAMDAFMDMECDVVDRRLLIPTLEGVMEANPGDWVIKGIKGEFYPCKPDIFEATYEPVKE